MELPANSIILSTGVHIVRASHYFNGRGEANFHMTRLTFYSPNAHFSPNYFYFMLVAFKVHSSFSPEICFLLLLTITFIEITSRYMQGCLCLIFDLNFVVLWICKASFYTWMSTDLHTLTFSGGFYSDDVGHVSTSCKKCPRGSFVAFDRAPGKQAQDCKTCPLGKYILQ